MDPCSAGTVRGGDGDFPGRPWRSDRACQGVRGVFEVGDQSAHSRTAACRDRVGRAGDDPAETEPAGRLQADQRRDGRATDPGGTAGGECHRELQGGRRRNSCLQAMAAHDRAGRRRCGQGGRLHGLSCDTGQSRRGRHAGPSAYRDRRITTIRIVRLIIEEHLPAGTSRNTVARTEATASKPGAINWWPGCRNSFHAAVANEQVQALVFIAGWMPDEGESIQQLLESKVFGDSLVPAALRPVPFTDADGSEVVDLYLDRELFPEAFAADVDPDTAAVIAVTSDPGAGQRQPRLRARPGWRSIPSWYLVGTEDRVHDAFARKIPMPLRLRPWPSLIVACPAGQYHLGGAGKPLSLGKLERWTRVGYERGIRARHGER